MENATPPKATGRAARLWRLAAAALLAVSVAWSGLAWAAPEVVVEPAGLNHLAAGGAATPSGAGIADGVQQQVRQLAMDGLRQIGDTPITRVEVQVGSLDPRLRLAPCSQVQPYVPTGSALWGRTRIGLRCVQGEKAWNVFLPITVRVMATALVASRSLPSGHVLAESDLSQAEVDLAENASGAVMDAALAQGRVLGRGIGPGQSLRLSHLKPRQWFAMGDVVTVVAVGPGYRVVSQGEAVTPGLEGQSARVKLESGRTLTGMPVADRQMELPL